MVKSGKRGLGEGLREKSSKYMMGKSGKREVGEGLREESSECMMWQEREEREVFMVAKRPPAIKKIRILISRTMNQQLTRISSQLAQFH